MKPRAYSSAIRDAQVEQTRTLLMDKAQDLLVEGGLEALTLPKLAQAAGVSAPTVYRHFPTLDDLFRAFLEWLRPQLGLTSEQLLSTTPEQLPSVPLDNFPRYEAMGAILRPLMESREFNRVRVESMGDRAGQASAHFKPHTSGWPSAQLEARVGVIWALNSPQVWRWMRDTWGSENDEAAAAASWAMHTLRDALLRGPDAKKSQKEGGIHRVEASPRARERRVEARARARERRVEKRPRTREQRKEAKVSKTLKRFVRVLSGMLGSLVLLVLLGVLVASLEANRKLRGRYSSHGVELLVPNPLTADELAALRAERNRSGDAAADPLVGLDLHKLAQERAVLRGKHLVEARYGCAGCHGADLAGGVMLDDFPIGTLRGPNLTTGKGGLRADYAGADWDRIVRHGIKPDGSPAVMPSEDFFAMTNHELSDIVSYIRSLPPVDAEVPKPSFGPVGKVLLALGKFPLSADKLPDHRRAHARVAPEAAVTPEFGAHLAATCTGCHRADLAGGPMPFGPPEWPLAANLTRAEAGLGTWSYEDFEQALTRGISKDGRKLREPMTHVLPGTRAMTATERKALWSYLVTVKPRPTVL